MPTLTGDPLAAIRGELEKKVRAGEARCVETLREACSELDPESTLELIYTEYVLRRDSGEMPDHASYAVRFPEYQERLERLFGLYDLLSSRETIPETMASGTAGLPRAFANTAPAEYEVLRELGRGGMAIVLLARQTSLQRLVALKILKSGPWLTAQEDARIRREAATAAKLSHPNIVPIYEVGEWNDSPFLAFEYIPGGTLAEALAKKPKFTAKEIAEFIATLARAMQYAHEQGVIHRDLKPANILLTDGTLARPKIADFGLSLAVDAANSQSGIIGTPGYMAPEQATGRRVAITPAADVYSLGVILYEMLAGQPPFAGATVIETLDQVRTAAPPPLSNVPRDLNAIVLQCLRKEPGDRYSTASRLAKDLERFQAGEPIEAHSSRRSVLKYGVAAGLLAAVGVWRFWPKTVTPEVLEAEPPVDPFRERKCFRGAEFAGAELVTSPDGRLLAWLDFTALKIRVFDLTTESFFAPVDCGNHRVKLAFADDSRLVIERQPHLPPSPLMQNRTRPIPWVGRDEFAIHNIRTGDDMKSLSMAYVQTQALDRARLATCDGKTITIRSVIDGAIVATIDDPMNLKLETVKPPAAAVEPNARKPSASRTTAIALNERRVVLHLEDKIHAWDVNPVRLVSAFRCETNLMSALVLSPNGDTVLGLRNTVTSAGGAMVPRILFGWDLLTGVLRFKLKYDDHAGAVTFLEDTRFAISVGQTIELRDSRTGDLLVTLRGHQDNVYRLAASPDGTRLYSTSADNTLRVWHIAPPA